MDSWTDPFSHPRIVEATVPYLRQLVPVEPVLANAFITENIPYEWTSGRREPRS